MADAVAEGPPDETVKAEREPGLWQRVGEYWWLGLDPGAPESGWTGKHDGAGRVFWPEDDGDYAVHGAFVMGCGAVRVSNCKSRRISDSFHDGFSAQRFLGHCAPSFCHAFHS